MLKGKNLKKEVFSILVLLINCFAYAYQKPIFRTGKATDYVALCLQYPPNRLGIKAVDINWDDIKPEKFSIDKKSGFFVKIDIVSAITGNPGKTSVFINKEQFEFVFVAETYDGYLKR